MMAQTASSPPSGFRAWLAAHSVRLWLAAMALLTLATRLPYLGHPSSDYDEQLYSLIGQGILDGKVPFVDMWDRKPPGLFLLFALFHKLGGPGPLAYQIPALLACLWGAWLTYRLGCRIGEKPAAGAAAALYPVLMALYGSHSGQSEVFYVPLTLAMAELLLCAEAAPEMRRTLVLSLAAMLIGGLALQIKYTVLPSCLLFGGLALLMLRRKGASWALSGASAALFGLMGLAPTLLAALWYAAHGAWDAFVFANFTSARLRLPMPLGITLGKQSLYAMPLVVFVLGGLAQAANMRKQGMALSPYYGLALAWLLAGIAGMFMGTTIYVYYYAALMPAVVLVAMPMFGPVSRLGPWIAAGIIAWLTISLHPLGAIETSRQERAKLDELAAAIRPQLNEHAEGLFIYDGPVVLYRLTGASSPTRFLYPDHLNNQLESKALPIDPGTEVARILKSAPGVIVTSPVPVTMRNPVTAAIVGTALDQHYRKALSIEFQERPIEVYIRKPG